MFAQVQCELVKSQTQVLVSWQLNSYYKIPLPQFTSELSQLLIPVSVGNLEVPLDLKFPFDKCIKNTNTTAFYNIIKIHGGLNPA